MNTIYLIIAVALILVLKNPVVNLFAIIRDVYIQHKQDPQNLKIKSYKKQCELPNKEEFKKSPCGHLGNCDDNCNVPYPFECNLPNPGYKYTLWSILDAVPPPDNDHQYREDTFSKEPLCLTDKNGKQVEVNDYDRWSVVWQPNENYSARYLKWSNDFLL